MTPTDLAAAARRDENVRIPADVTRAVALVSGGIDSAVVLEYARRFGVEVHSLSIDYGQTHSIELARAAWQARRCKSHTTLSVPLSKLVPSALTFGVALTTRTLEELRSDPRMSPAYVPGRNLVFLSIAAAYAEALGVDAILIGATAEDCSAFPDCRREFFDAFEKVSGRSVLGPLLQMRKLDVVDIGNKWGVDFSRTWSCYLPAAEGRACGRCDACLIRLDAFERLNLVDPIDYAVLL